MSELRDWVSIGTPPDGPVSAGDRDEDGDEYGDFGYIYLPPKCGLCLKAICEDDKIIAMLGNDDSTLPVYHSKINRYLVHIRSQYPKRWLGHRHRKEYTSMNETVAFHAECYHLFLRCHGQPNALESLWTSVAWRYPWRPRANAVHEIDFEDHDLPWIRPSVATALGMPKLALLPPTILREIRAESLRSKLWDYSDINNLAERMSMAANQGDGTHCQVDKLDEIEAWERGQPPARMESASESKITKLTLDRHGVRKIESLSDWPHKAVTSPIQARLSFDSEGPDFPQIWDTPTPPVKELSLTPRTARSLDPRFRTVDLRNTTGLTFFYQNRSILRIHSHTASSPTALETYRRLPATVQEKLVWAYVPISPNDRILEFAVRESNQLSTADWLMFREPTVIIRTKLLDDFILGHWQGTIKKDQLFEFTPHILVYTVSNALGCVAFGAVGEPDPNAQLGNPMPVLNHFPGVWTPRDVIKAHAPLDGAYENGAQRAVGLCRIGIDPFTTYRNPVNFCYASSIHPNWDKLPEFERYHVVCTTEGDTHDHSQHWNCFPMQGTIKYVWNSRGTSLEVDRRT
ncbi:uncharacterized protein B0J16DRAFT_312944 [Fusarium flagelliforme]|uniref:uncharacterized protein n=1 Tax=Fusarium flagelliforme TaxID=2675880 RepID=UPI001E8CBE37|nr:uncharacterized protein B0J16DRAFT_312944 [Fusarium flagelliforme]KAH7196596.1 hypothetical protein B0J16DRAFT_312944 [Fusarium flagelliforme]